MLRNLNKVLHDNFGNQLIEKITSLNEEGKPVFSDTPVTYKNIFIMALLHQAKDERKASADEMVKRYALALRLQQGDEHEISLDEASVLKQLVYAAYPSPLIYGQVHHFLEPREPAGA